MATAPALDLGSYADLLAAQVEQLTDEVMRRALPRQTEVVQAPEFWEVQREVARGSLLAEFDALRSGGSLPERLPEVDAYIAQTAAAFDSLPGLLVGYRVGHAVQWEAFLRLVMEREQDDQARRALLKTGSDFFFAYADLMCELVTEEYERERDLRTKSAEQRRMHIVQQVLEGGDPQIQGLGYPLDQHHRGAIAWGADAGKLVRELGETTGRSVLALNPVQGLWWVWLGSKQPLPTGRHLALPSPAGHDARLVFGAEAFGPEGFRETHRQAERVWGIVDPDDEPVVWFEDVALELLALSDEQEATAFVTATLDTLDGEDARSRRARQTLQAYFATGHNAAAAAARLGVHEQTVAARLRSVEEQLGVRITERHAELELALRLRRRLAARSTPDRLLVERAEG